MKKKNFKDLPSEDTPINSANLMGMQNDIEESVVAVSPTKPITKENVWFQKGKNLSDKRNVEIGKAWNNTTNKDRATLYVKISGNEKYTFSFKNCGNFEIFYFEKATITNNELTVGLTSISNSSPTTKITNKSSNYIGFQFNKTNISKNDFTNAEIQIEAGPEATTYSPYIPKKILTKNANGIFEEFYNEEEINKEDYSTAEQIVGTWIDGKPIYQKTIDFGALPNTSEKKVAHNIIGLDNLIECNAISKNVSAGNMFVIPLASTKSNKSNIFIYINPTYIIIGTGEDRTYFTRTFVTLKYTKF